MEELEGRWVKDLGFEDERYLMPNFQVERDCKHVKAS